jgi:hypothetical protein
MVPPAVPGMRSWLADGEQLIVRSRPHARVLVMPIAVGVVVLAVTFMMLAWLQPEPYHRLLPDGTVMRQPAIVLVLTAAVMVEAAYPLRRCLQWAGTKYLLTSRRIVTREGWLRRTRRDFPLAAVRYTQCKQNLAQRMVRSGNLVLDMGESGVGTINDVPEVNTFRDYTVEAIDDLSHAAIRKRPAAGDYADEVDLTGRELRKLGRDH